MIGAPPVEPLTHHSIIYALGGVPIMDNTFDNIVIGGLTQYNSVLAVMGQCFSGGFINDFEAHTNVAIATASRFDETASGCGGFSYFLDPWEDAVDTTKAVNKPQFLDAFNYAKSQADVNDPGAIPQYASNNNVLDSFTLQSLIPTVQDYAVLLYGLDDLSINMDGTMRTSSPSWAAGRGSLRLPDR